MPNTSTINALNTINARSFTNDMHCFLYRLRFRVVRLAPASLKNNNKQNTDLLLLLYLIHKHHHTSYSIPTRNDKNYLFFIYCYIQSIHGKFEEVFIFHLLLYKKHTRSNLNTSFLLHVLDLVIFSIAIFRSTVRNNAEACLCSYLHYVQ